MVTDDETVKKNYWPPTWTLKTVYVTKGNTEQCVNLITYTIRSKIVPFNDAFWRMLILHSTTLLTHWGWVTHISVSQISHHCFKYWFFACLAPSHYLNQCWLVVNWNLRNYIQWHFDLKLNIFIQDNVSKCRLQNVSHIFWANVNTLDILLSVNFIMNCCSGVLINAFI